MNRTKILSVSFISVLTVLAVSCSAQKTEISKSSDTAAPQVVDVQLVDAEKVSKIKSQSHGYTKPGAAITLSHDFTGFVQPGSSGSVKVTLKGASSGGEMVVRASSDDNIAVSRETAAQRFAMKGQPNNVMDIAFSTQAPGLHYINLQVMTVDAAGNELGRAFTIPVQVGDPKYNKPTPQHPDLQTTPSGEKLIVMDAEEN